MTDLDPPAPQPRRTCIGNRACTALAAALWPAAIAVWLLFLAGAIRNQNIVTAAFMWLMTAGGFGARALGLRILGPFATERALRFLAGAGAGGALILTIEYLTGDLRPGVVSLYATLMLPMGVGMHSYRALMDMRRSADTETRVTGSYQQGVRDGRAMESRRLENPDCGSVRRLHERTDDELAAFLEELEDIKRAVGLIYKARREQAQRAQGVPPALSVVRDEQRRSG